MSLQEISGVLLYRADQEPPQQLTRELSMTKDLPNDYPYIEADDSGAQSEKSLIADVSIDNDEE